MKKSVLLSISSLTALALLTACNPTKQNVGMIAGAAVGAIAAPVIFGNSAWYTIVGGAAVGGVAGNYIGKKLDDRTSQQVAYTLNQAPDNQPYQFMNHEQNNVPDLTVTPLRSYQISNQLCRDFELSNQEAGKTIYEKGSACQQDNGDWKIRA